MREKLKDSKMKLTQAQTNGDTTADGTCSRSSHKALSYDLSYSSMSSIPWDGGERALNKDIWFDHIHPGLIFLLYAAYLRLAAVPPLSHLVTNHFVYRNSYGLSYGSSDTDYSLS